MKIDIIPRGAGAIYVCGEPWLTEAQMDIVCMYENSRRKTFLFEIRSSRWVFFPVGR
jgi:hypothetical protein